MRKWEKDYQQMSSSTELDEKIELLEDKINGKVAFKEEYAEHKKLTAIKENLPKVKNILDLRGMLDKENKEIKAEIARRDGLTKINKEIDALEEEMQKLEKEYSELEAKMKDCKSADEKEKLAGLIKENENKRQENNRKFGDHQEKLAEAQKEDKDNKYKDLTLEDLNEKSCQNSIKISKCNLACNKLMQGYSWKSVEVALDNYKGKTMTAKKEQVEKMDKNKKAVKAGNAPVKTVDVTGNKIEKTETEQEEERTSFLSRAGEFIKNAYNTVKNRFVNEEEKTEENETSLVVQNEKESVFSKIKSFAKKMYDKIKGKSVENEKEPEPEAKVEETAKVEEPKTVQPDNFKEYLKFVAENGVNVDPAAKMKEDEISKTVQRILEAKEAQAKKDGKPFDLESATKTARAVAENRYNMKNKSSQQNEGPEL